MTEAVIEQHDSAGRFMLIEPDPEAERDGGGDARVAEGRRGAVSPEDGGSEGEELSQEEPQVAELQLENQQLKEENSALADEVSKLQRGIDGEKQKYRELWRMQLREWDEVIEGKDAEIACLTQRITVLESSGTVDSASHTPGRATHLRLSPLPPPLLSLYLSTSGPF